MRDINEVTIVGTINNSVVFAKTAYGGHRVCHFIVLLRRGERFLPSTSISLSMIVRVNCYDELVNIAEDLRLGDRVFVRGELMNRKVTTARGEMWFTEIKALFIGHIDFSADDSSSPNDEKGDTDGETTKV